MAVTVRAVEAQWGIVIFHKNPRVICVEPRAQLHLFVKTGEGGSYLLGWAVSGRFTHLNRSIYLLMTVDIHFFQPIIIRTTAV